MKFILSIVAIVVLAITVQAQTSHGGGGAGPWTEVSAGASATIPNTGPPATTITNTDDPNTPPVLRKPKYRVTTNEAGKVTKVEVVFPKGSTGKVTGADKKTSVELDGQNTVEVSGDGETVDVHGGGNTVTVTGNGDNVVVLGFEASPPSAINLGTAPPQGSPCNNGDVNLNGASGPHGGPPPTSGISVHNVNGTGNTIHN